MRSKASVYHTDGTLESVSEYDKNENQIKWSLFKEGGEIRFYETNEYDEMGYKVRSDHYEANGTLEYYTVYEYDKIGRASCRERV